MLEHTFIHIEGIGPKTEKRLWDLGVRTWRDYLERGSGVFSADRNRFVREELLSSISHREDIRYFRDRLCAGDMWRVFRAFKENAVYLDIETSGGLYGMDEITVIGLYDGRRVRSFINGVNLHDLEAAIADYDLVVTFNGSTFDLPFISHWFPNISLPAGHIDLRYLLGKLGYRGGLKKIEKSLGIRREDAIDGMDGYEAVMLWKAYQWGDAEALERLVRYNTADIVNLAPLMETAYEEMKKRTLPSEPQLGVRFQALPPKRPV